MLFPSCIVDETVLLKTKTPSPVCTGEGDEMHHGTTSVQLHIAALSEEQSFLLRCNRRNRIPAICACAFTG